MKAKHIKDFEMVVDPTPLTPEEKLAISEFIKKDKVKKALNDIGAVKKKRVLKKPLVRTKK